MKNYMKWLLGFFAFVLVLLGATLVYTKLSLNYVGQQEANRTQIDMAKSGQSSRAQTDIAKDIQASETQTDTIEVIDFKMLNEDGETVDFSELLGKPVILNFWATWCGSCQMEMPHIDEAYQEYSEEINFVLVDLTDGKRDKVDTAKQFVEDAGYSFPIYFDTELRGAYAYGAYSIPLTYFFNERGEIVSSRIGAMTREDLFEQIQLILPSNE